MAIAAVPVSLDDAVISHYRLVAPLMDANFGNIPIVWTTYADEDPRTKPDWHEKYFGHYSHLSSEHLQHLVSIGAREFYSWAPIPQDMNRCRFLRFLLERPNVTTDMVKKAAHALRAVLHEDGREAIPLLDGEGNITLWVPVGGGPDYASARAYCYTVAKRLVEREPDLVSLVPNTHVDGRVHLHVASNAVGRFSMLPYSLRRKTMRVATPIGWDELEHIDIEGLSIDDFAKRLLWRNDVFAELLAKIEALPVPQVSEIVTMQIDATTRYGAFVCAAIAILQDGIARTGREIYDEAISRKLLKPGDVPNVDSVLDAYIVRTRGQGLRPVFVKTPDHRKFQINQPPDGWPQIPEVPLSLSSDARKIAERLHTAAAGNDPDGFEIAVCDAFAALNFTATHVGGRGAPDGYIDAPLGALGYRVMIECKSGMATANPFEAAKYREPYGAQYAISVVARISKDNVGKEEAVTHGVALWTLDDVVTALTLRPTPIELVPCFQPGVLASDVLQEVQWNRTHGESKRVRIVADFIHKAGWTTQTAAVEADAPKDAPLLTEDAAMLIVDQELVAQKCSVSCTREQVRLAFEYLTNPLVGAAVWTDSSKSAVVLVSPP